MTEAVHALVRVWLADRPGALGLVASRIGAVRGDIVAIDVLERGDGVAIDEFAVNLPNLEALDVMVREVEQVDGCSIEQVRVVNHYPDARIDALESAALLCEAADAAHLQKILVTHVLDEFIGHWSALVVGGEVVASAGGLPDPSMVAALALGTSASDAVAAGTAGPDDLAVAFLSSHEATLLLGREGPPFRVRERTQLRALTRIADRMWSLLGS
ncbi:MAG: hypothetical protein HYU28_02745 [Actinobacteria bacterium]|nr:hypothetical protein [Actinomycetota bacterium]